MTTELLIRFLLDVDEGWHAKPSPVRWPTHCYDFPTMVLHVPVCPRYGGGVCRPWPAPQPPLSDVERTVVHEWAVLMLRRLNVPTICAPHALEPVTASGSTILPPREGRA